MTFSRLVFSALLKVSGTYRVDLAIEWPREVVYRHFAFLCFVFLGAAPIPYVQAAILNLLHPLHVTYTQGLYPFNAHVNTMKEFKFPMLIFTSAPSTKNYLRNVKLCYNFALLLLNCNIHWFEGLDYENFGMSRKIGWLHRTRKYNIFTCSKSL